MHEVMMQKNIIINMDENIYMEQLVTAIHHNRINNKKIYIYKYLYVRRENIHINKQEVVTEKFLISDIPTSTYEFATIVFFKLLLTRA